MNKRSFWIPFFSFLVLTTNLLFGQINYCGTYVSNSQKNFEAAIPDMQASLTQSLPQVNRTLSITVFLVREKDPPNFNKNKLDSIITSLNQYFAPIALSFKICAIQYVDNFQFDMLDANSNAKDLCTQYSEPSTINLYLATSITDAYGSTVKGYTYMPGDTGKNYIFASKSGLSGLMLAHQLGHFFNLYHTHETALGDELPDETNCKTTGDRCCDTDASPDLSIDGMVTGCTYSGNAKISNQFYSPSVKNMMALSSEDCRCVFSKTQFLRMIYTLNTFRKDLR